jgi:hypothetical protein
MPSELDVNELGWDGLEQTVVVVDIFAAEERDVAGHCVPLVMLVVRRLPRQNVVVLPLPVECVAVAGGPPWRLWRLLDRFGGDVGRYRHTVLAIRAQEVAISTLRSFC